jgi:hypothetical protein
LSSPLLISRQIPVEFVEIMHTSATYSCQSCPESTEFLCHGCQKRFCAHHAYKHQQSLNEQLDWFTVDHDDFLDRLQRTSFIPSKFEPYKCIIDQWERETIRDVRKAADEARQALLEARQCHLDDLKMKLDQLTTQLHQAYQQTTMFDERTILQWSNKLRLLEQDLRTMSSFAVRIHGNKPIVMPIIKIQPDNQHETTLNESCIPNAVGIVSVQRSTKSYPCLCNIDCQDQLVRSTSAENQRSKSFLYSDELFHTSTDHARICDAGQLIVHDSSKFDASIRGTNEYSYGEHRVHLRIERMTTDSWLFIGVLSKHESFSQHAYMSSSAYGWTEGHNIYANGKIISNNHENQSRMKEQDVIELTIDCHRRALHLSSSTNVKRQRLPVELRSCSFPWQLLIAIRNSNDSIRILPTSNGIKYRREQDKQRKHRRHIDSIDRFV